MPALRSRTILMTGAALLLALASFLADRWFSLGNLAGGITWLGLVGRLAGVMAACGLLSLVTRLVVLRRGKPEVEARMLARLYWLVGVVVLAIVTAHGFGVAASMLAVFGAFGGMLLGWSLQAPVSGFAAWVLVSFKRPFRPGDRVQFPSLNLTGDIKEIGAMYTVLDQVGGSIASEEAVGRYILVPNAMLFTQVVINYTVCQEAAYMLDEVVVRITFDSNWTNAEAILLRAANAVTQDIIDATGEKPYIRADLYDYGVYLRLRYQTRVQDRVIISYKINKLIFEEIQSTPTVDLAIPFVYSYRAGFDRRRSDENARDEEAKNIADLDIARIVSDMQAIDTQDLDQLARSIAKDGLLQPIVVVRRVDGDGFDILAGHLRFEACKKLGWSRIPAIVRDRTKTQPTG